MLQPGKLYFQCVLRAVRRDDGVALHFEQASDERADRSLVLDEQDRLRLPFPHRGDAVVVRRGFGLGPDNGLGSARQVEREGRTVAGGASR